MSDRPPPAYEWRLDDDPFAVVMNSSSTIIPHPSQLRWPSHHPRNGTYYIVTSGHDVGIFVTWAEAGNATSGVPDNIHQSVQGWDEAVRIYSIAHAAGAISIIPRPSPYRGGASGSASQPHQVSSTPSTPGAAHRPIAVGSSPAPTPSPYSGPRGGRRNPVFVASSPATRRSATPAPAAGQPPTTPARQSRSSATPAPPFTQARTGAAQATPSRTTYPPIPRTPESSARRLRTIERALSLSPSDDEGASTPAREGTRAPKREETRTPKREATPTPKREATRTPTPVLLPATTMSNDEFAMRIRAVEEALLFYTSRNGGRMPPPAAPAPDTAYYEARLTALETCVNELLTREAMRVSTREAMRASVREHLSQRFLQSRARLFGNPRASPSPAHGDGRDPSPPNRGGDGRDVSQPRTPVAGSSTGYGTASHIVQPHSPITIDDYELPDADTIDADAIVGTVEEFDWFSGFDDFTEEQQVLANQLLDDVSSAYAESIAKGKGKGKGRDM